MKKKYIHTIVILWIAALAAQAQTQNAERQLSFDNLYRYSKDAQQVKDDKKEKSIKTFRNQYATVPYRAYDLTKIKTSIPEILAYLNEDGTFTDWASREKKVIEGKDTQEMGLFITDAMNRLWKLSEEFRNDRMGVSLDKDVFRKLQKSVLYYGNLEVSRSNKVNRFHASCFAIPTAAVNIYYCFLKQMDAVENGKTKDQLLVDMCEMLKTLALQSWTQPLRNDETDKNVVQIERFRNHVWWVGGNALAYRPLLPVAMMYRSIPMVDLLVQVAQGGISYTSQNTYNTAFWTEGCTADGAGWGHGMQCLVWGYPIDGGINALTILGALKSSPWDKKLTDDNIETLLNFIRGSNWYYYKGNITPYVDRFTSRYTPAKVDIRTLAIVDKLLKDWADSFTPAQKDELRSFQRDARKQLISMNGYSAGMYNGTRWFFNNDDLIKKNDRYHLIVNMASVRCDGLESAVAAADEYNFYPTDGMTLFQKNGNEYREVIGAWDITMTPGVTAREGAEKLTPVTNWRGYCSKHNYAAASTNGGENAVAGYIFEKMDANDKIESEKKKNTPLKNEVLYGVKAYKSYFMLGDYMVALGAGITNLTPQMEGAVRTTIDQPKKESEVVVWSNGKTLPVGNGVQDFPKDDTSFWVVQKGKFAYSILPQYTQKASFVCETLKTDWVKRNSANKSIKDLPSQVDVLRLWIDHTQKPVNDTYGYVVYAGEGMPEMELPFEVLRNDTLVQAVKSKDSKVIEAVFYQSGVVLDKGGVKLEVSAPCTVLIEDVNGKTTVSVTDAAMNAELKEIVLQWNGKRIPVAMPQGSFCGKPASITL